MSKERADREARRRRSKMDRMERDRTKTGGGSSTVLTRGGLQFEFLKPKAGQHLRLHILPYIIQSDRHPEVFHKRMEVGDEDYFLEYGVHRNVGPDGNSSVMCLEVTYGDRCPICEDARTQRKQGQRDDLPWPSRKVVYNVMDADGDSEIMVFDVSENLFHKELKGKLGRSERGFFDYSDLQEGAIVKCWVEEKRGGKYTFNQYKDFEFVDRDPLPANLLEKAIPLETLLNVPTVEDVDALFDGQIASIDYQNGNEESESDGGSSEPVEDESDEEVDEAPESETSAPKEEEKEEKLSAKEKSRARSKAAKKDRCKCGLRFGKDWDTVKEKCVAQCDDLEFDECRIAQEAAE